MNLLDSYLHKISSGELIEDSQQYFIIQKFQAIYDALCQKKTFLSRLNRPLFKGLYLWGSVGIGKTFLMDTFYHALPLQTKWRTHFLAFMQEVQTQLRVLQGTRNPLSVIAKKWSKKASIICFDEFAVNDIADALILEKLLETFFAEGICMIFTSNQAPDDLYRNGIQRALFLPAIEKIKTYTEVIHLTAEQDYRARYATQAGGYYWYPLTFETQQKMERIFQKLTQNALFSQDSLCLFDRKIRVQKYSDRTIWFNFLDICGVPRHQADYLYIAEHFDTILISKITSIRPHETDLARSFIQLIDVLYDTKNRLVMSAALPMDHIYTKGKLLFEFKRTCSRLMQMQSEDWKN